MSDRSTVGVLQRVRTARHPVAPRLAAAAHEVHAGGGDLESVIHALLSFAECDRTAVLAAAEHCRDLTQPADPDCRWRALAVTLELAAGTGLFVS